MGQKGRSTWKGTIVVLLQKMSLEWKSVPRSSAAMGRNWKHSSIMCLALPGTWKRDNSQRGSRVCGVFLVGVFGLVIFKCCIWIVFCLFDWCFCWFVRWVLLLGFFVSQQGCLWWAEVRKIILCVFFLTCEKIGKIFKGKYSILSRLKCRWKILWLFS